MGIIKWLSDFVGKGFADDLLSGVKDKIEETIEDTQERVERVTKHVVKSMALLLIFLIGFVFLLIGLGQVIEEKFVSLSNGMGFVLVGGTLVIIALIVKALK